MVGLAALPVTRSVSVRKSRLSWEGELKPTPLSARYLVRIDASTGRRPRVKVISPQLPEAVRDLPHVFGDGSLCLCYPQQWDRTKQIARTIVPWISEWLAHYEFWRATGEWHGGGHEEPDPELDSPTHTHAEQGRG